MALNTELGKMPIYAWVILFVLLLAQGAWIFWDASKRKEQKWLWGLLGLLNVPSGLIIYLLATRITVKHNQCHHCGKSVRVSYVYCPHCGEKIK